MEMKSYKEVVEKIGGAKITINSETTIPSNPLELITGNEIFSENNYNKLVIGKAGKGMAYVIKKNSL